MELWEVAFLAGAAFVGGAINSVAGGGSLVSFPALIVTGYATRTANVTNTVALWPGYVAGSFGYREELTIQRERVTRLLLPSVLGALAGSAILLWTPESAFDRVVPFLVLFACLLLAAQDRLAALASKVQRGGQQRAEISWGLWVAVALLAVYGAYFGAGLGILTLAVLGILLPDDIQRSNALKGVLSAIINFAAVAFFAAFGPVRWLPALIMAIGAIAGGYLGVGVARRLGRTWLRRSVIAYGLVLTVVLFTRI